MFVSTDIGIISYRNRYRSFPLLRYQMLPAFQ